MLLPRTDAVQWMASLSLSPLRSCMDASVDKCFPFLCWLVCSQDQGTAKEKDDKNHGQQNHEEAGDEGFALVAWPLFSLSLSVVTLCSMVLCFRSSFFGSNCFCLPCSLSLVHLPGHFFGGGGCYNRKLAAVADTADGVSMVRLDNLFLLLFPSFLAKSVIEHYSVSKEPQAQLVNHHHHCCFSFVFGT